jgi:uncharacterized membrane protein HdeD (DUF308 family)
MFKFDPRVLIGYAILLLLITGTLTYLNVASDSIEQAAVITYWLLVSAIVYSVIELYRKRKKYPGSNRLMRLSFHLENIVYSIIY